MGLSESTLKVIIDPISHLLSSCGHSHCESECVECCKLKIHTNDTDEIITNNHSVIVWHIVFNATLIKFIKCNLIRAHTYNLYIICTCS